MVCTIESAMFDITIRVQNWRYLLNWWNRFDWTIEHWVMYLCSCIVACSLKSWNCDTDPRFPWTKKIHQPCPSARLRDTKGVLLCLCTGVLVGPMVMETKGIWTATHRHIHLHVGHEVDQLFMWRDTTPFGFHDHRRTSQQVKWEFITLFDLTPVVPEATSVVRDPNVPQTLRRWLCLNMWRNAHFSGDSLAWFPRFLVREK